ncbi:MAG: molybdate ABC transporter substrate-binding protein [Deltaproteobacteria bacterium]|nr:molybdate ABC transporter substrate-binding protein [Deltaproteobacteria bacterium]
MKQVLILIIALILSGTLFGRELKVAAAANTQNVIHELAREFYVLYGQKIQVILASSGKLAAQILNGAPFDLFLSANMKYPQYLYQKGLTSQKPEIYAKGTLVLWSMGKADLSKGLEVFDSKAITHIALANPRNAPYGQEAVRALKFLGIFDKIKPKLIYGESISQANQFIYSKEVDLGITSKSTVLSPAMRGKGTYFELDPKSYEPILQGAVILKRGLLENPELAREFYQFLFSEQARKIFLAYGYQLP